MVKNEDILKPLIFLDIFDYPPTTMEIWRFLGVEAELHSVVISNEAAKSEKSIKEDYNNLMKNQIATDKVVARRIEADSLLRSATLGMTEKNGFYFLNNGEKLIEKRRDFFKLSEKKFKVAQKAARILRFVPGVKMAAICNNFYYTKDSDIDFFIIIEKNRMWLARALATIALHIFRLRRHGKKIADRICLSFYITEDNLNLESLTLKKSDDKSVDDPYFCYWLGFLQPIYDIGGIYEKFWQVNFWIKNFFPNIFPNETNETKKIKDNFFSVFWKKINSVWFGGFVGNFLERVARKIQLSKMSNRRSPLRETGGETTHPREGNVGVVISDNILKFHENDRREYFREQLKIKSARLMEKN